MHSDYLFTSDRLGFRIWKDEDLESFAKMNADAEVMEHFPDVLSLAQSKEFLVRLKAHFLKHGFNYFATELLSTGEWIGFIGLAFQTYESNFTPAVDIGWRLKKSAWGKGYATEGANRCLAYAFDNLEIDSIISTCTINNNKSEKVMQKIGMTKMGEFDHPNLKNRSVDPKCVWYKIDKK